jgi:hypothetical protein
VISSEYCVNLDSVHISGVSNGGMFTYYAVSKLRYILKRQSHEKPIEVQCEWVVYSHESELGFFRQSIPLGLLINRLNHFCIWLRVRREIRKYK